MSWTGRSSASRTVDAYGDWTTREAGRVVLHANATVPDTTLDEVARSCDGSLTRVEELAGTDTGAGEGGETGEGRIDCYLYPSLEEKLRVTNNGAIAHRVEWADAVHLAWVDGAEAALTREVFKLVDAKAHGKVYTPLIRDGLAVYAGRTWGGLPVREAGADLLERRVLPDLELLVDTRTFVQLDEKLSQPAAGSLVALLVSEEGVETVRGLYAAYAGRPDQALVFLESALGDSLGAVETRWHEYLASHANASGPSSPDAE